MYAPVSTASQAKRGHRDQVDAEKLFVTLRGQRLVVRAITAVELDQRAGASQQIKRAEAHAVDEGPETACGGFHAHYCFIFIVPAAARLQAVTAGRKNYQKR